jgi:hypothetical protein
MASQSIRAMRTENNRAFREREITRDQFIDRRREIDEIERQRADQRPWCQAPTSAQEAPSGSWASVSWDCNRHATAGRRYAHVRESCQPGKAP